MSKTAEVIDTSAVVVRTQSPATDRSGELLSNDVSLRGERLLKLQTS
jgi:hypothetical protein